MNYLGNENIFGNNGNYGTRINLHMKILCSQAYIERNAERV